MQRGWLSREQLPMSSNAPTRLRTSGLGEASESTPVHVTRLSIFSRVDGLVLARTTCGWDEGRQSDGAPSTSAQAPEI